MKFILISLFLFDPFMVKSFVMKNNDDFCIESYFLQLENNNSNAKMYKILNCGERVEEYKKWLNESYLNFDSNKTCALQFQEDYQVIDFLLKMTLLHVTEITFKKLIAFSREPSDEIILNVNETIEMWQDLQNSTCQSDDDLKINFDARFRNRTGVTLDQDETCMKHIFLYLQIINATEFDVNPATINFTTCEAFLENFTEDNFHNKFTNKVHRAVKSATKLCMKNNHRETAAKHASFKTIETFPMTDEKLYKVKENFVKTEREMTKAVIECVTSHTASYFDLLLINSAWDSLHKTKHSDLPQIEHLF